MTEAIKSSYGIKGASFAAIDGSSAYCDLEFITLARGETVVICSQRFDSRAVDVTNYAEFLAMTVCDKRGIDPWDLIWVEHHPERANKATGSPLKPTWSLVTFKYERLRGGSWRFVLPVWRHMTCDDWWELGLKART